MTRLHARRIAIVLALCGAGCGGSGGGSSGGGSAPGASGAPAPAAPAYPATADGLKKLFQDIRAAHDARDFAKAAKMTKELIPDLTSVQKALRDDAAATAKQIADKYASEPMPPDERAAGLLAGKPAQTVVQVHGATTEEIAANAQGSVAFNEFPGGARKAAEKVLRPGVTFYEVEWLEPGKDAGMKYHLFFHDGSAWKMLGKVWQVLGGD